MFLIPIIFKLTAKFILYAWHKECCLHCDRENTVLIRHNFFYFMIVFDLSFSSNPDKIFYGLNKVFLPRHTIFTGGVYANWVYHPKWIVKIPEEILHQTEKNTKFPYPAPKSDTGTKVTWLKFKKSMELLNVRMLKGFSAIIQKYLPNFIAVSST